MIYDDLNSFLNWWFSNGRPPDSMAPIRVLPHYWHGGTFGENGASFFSVQKYLNGTLPTCAGCDWVGDDGSVIGDVTSR